MEAEPGCGRHLASTVDTGLPERNGTLLAELRLKRVLVPALRAFHRRPRGKKASQMHGHVNVARDRQQGRCSLFARLREG